MSGATCLGLYRWPCGRQICGPVQQWLASEAACDVAGLADGRLGGIRITTAHEVLGVVEQAVGEVVGGAVLAQARHRGREGSRGSLVAVVGCEAGTGQFTFGPEHRGEVPGLVGVEQDEQFAGGSAVPQFVGSPRRTGRHPPGTHRTAGTSP